MRFIYREYNTVSKILSETSGNFESLDAAQFLKQIQHNTLLVILSYCMIFSSRISHSMTVSRVV